MLVRTKQLDDLPFGHNNFLLFRAREIACGQATTQYSNETSITRRELGRRELTKDGGADGGASLQIQSQQIHLFQALCARLTAVCVCVCLSQCVLCVCVCVCVLVCVCVCVCVRSFPVLCGCLAVIFLLYSA
jgi:hypothetical protein